jgi:hypothetical protein
MDKTYLGEYAYLVEQEELDESKNQLQKDLAQDFKMKSWYLAIPNSEDTGSVYGSSPKAVVKPAKDSVEIHISGISKKASKPNVEKGMNKFLKQHGVKISSISKTGGDSETSNYKIVLESAEIDEASAFDKQAAAERQLGKYVDGQLADIIRNLEDAYDIIFDTNNSWTKYGEFLNSNSTARGRINKLVRVENEVSKLLNKIKKI